MSPKFAKLTKNQYQVLEMVDSNLNSFQGFYIKGDALDKFSDFIRVNKVYQNDCFENSFCAFIWAINVVLILINNLL